MYKECTEVIGETPVAFGKYKDQLTFQQVWEADKQYSSWVMMTAGSSNQASPELRKLAAYLTRAEVLEAGAEAKQNEEAEQMQSEAYQEEEFDEDTPSEASDSYNHV